MNATIPKIMISTPEILFIHNKFLSLILLLNRLINVVSVVHHKEAPIKTPSTSSVTELISDCLFTIPNPANTAAKTNKEIGFEIVRKNIEIKSLKIFLSLDCLRI